MAISISKIDPNKLGSSGMGGMPGAKTPTQSAPSTGFSLGQTIRNVPGSAAELVKGTAQAVFNPIDTAKAVGSVAVGGVQKLLPGQQAQEQSFDALTNFYKQRYGSVENFLQTVQNDPVGFAADAATVLTGGGAVASKLGTVGKLSGLAKAGKTASTIGNIVDPLRAPVNVIGAGKTAVGAGQRAFGAVDDTERFLSNTQRPGAAPFSASTEIPISYVVPANGASKLPDVTKMLQKSTFRLTNAETATYARRGLDNAVQTVEEFKIFGSPEERVSKATNYLNKFEQRLQEAFQTSGVKTNKNQLISDLNEFKKTFVGERDVVQMEAQVDSAIEAIKRIPGDDMDAATLNKLKRSTYENAYNKAGDKVLDDVEHLIGDVIKKRLIDDHGDIGVRTDVGTEIPLKDFNEKFYSRMIETKKILKIAEKRTQISNVQARLVGAALGQFLVGGAPGIIMGSISSPLVHQLPITSVVSRTAGTIGKAADKLGNVTDKARKVAPVAEKAALVGERVNESQQPAQESLLDKLRKTFSFKLSPTEEDINSI